MNQRQRNGKIVFLVLGIIFLLCCCCGGLFGGAFGFGGALSGSVPDDYEEAEATIVDIVGRDSDDTTYYVNYWCGARYIEYADFDNVYYSGWKRGDTVTIYYDPDSPYEIVGTASFTTWMAVIGFVVMFIGLVLGVIGIIMLLKYKKSIGRGTGQYMNNMGDPSQYQNNNYNGY